MKKKLLLPLALVATSSTLAQASVFGDAATDAVDTMSTDVGTVGTALMAVVGLIAVFGIIASLIKRR